MSVFGTLPKHKSINDVVTFSKSERKFNTQIPEPCTEFDFKDFTQTLLSDCLRFDYLKTEHFYESIHDSKLNDRRDQCKVKISKHSEILDKLPSFAKAILQYPGVCIAGGSVVNIVTGIDKTNDYDIYFYGIDEKRLLEILNNEFEKFPDQYIRDFFRYGCFIQFKIDKVKYQLMTVQYRTPQEIVQYFDNGVCQICVTSKDIYITDYARFCFLNNVVIYDTDQHIGKSYNRRILKYHTEKNLSVLFPYLHKSSVFSRAGDLIYDDNRLDYVCTYVEDLKDSENIRLSKFGYYTLERLDVIKNFVYGLSEDIPCLGLHNLNMKKVKYFDLCKNETKRMKHYIKHILSSNILYGFESDDEDGPIYYKRHIQDPGRHSRPITPDIHFVNARYSIMRKNYVVKLKFTKTTCEDDMYKSYGLNCGKSHKEIFGGIIGYSESLI